jgi:hypothetical protein
MTYTLSKSISTDTTTTLTTSKGNQFSLTAGVQGMNMGGIPLGPSFSIGNTWTSDESKAVAESMGLSDTDSVASAFSLNFSLLPGVNYNGWFSPTMECQAYTKICNDVEVKTEVCTPMYNDAEKKDPITTSGVMAI